MQTFIKLFTILALIISFSTAQKRKGSNKKFIKNYNKKVKFLKKLKKEVNKIKRYKKRR